MNKKKLLGMFVGVMVSTLSLISCGDSNIQSGGASGEDVGFDPTLSSNLEVVGYEVIKNRLLVDFGLTVDSEAYQMLEEKRELFDISNPSYNSLFAVYFTQMMGLACGEADPAKLFPDGATIDNAWKKFTGSNSDDAAKDVESEMLSAAGSADDVRKFALCMGAALNARSVFINFNI